MENLLFHPEDVKQCEALGISEEQVRAQIETFEKGNVYFTLNRPCTRSDGIIYIPGKEVEELTLWHKEAALQGRLLKFMPASGAASRMFETLLRFTPNKERMNRDDLIRKSKEDPQAQDVLTFMKGIKQCPFFEDLKSVIGRDGFDVDTLIERGQFKEIIEYILTDRGLNYANLSKGLLKFHRYPEGGRTALEEHLVEATGYVQDGKSVCRLHLTVSPEHGETFVRFFEEVKPLYEKKYHVRFQVDFSLQKQSTNTIAVDMHNKLFRERGGKLLFRPGGHGALLQNLNDIKGDVIYIKNIDNVVPDQLKSITFLWKKALGGYLIALQKKIFGYLKRLSQGEEEKDFIHEVLGFARERLYLKPPKGGQLASVREKKEFLFHKLNRPLRVCGVVKNEGEPGGGPFWVEEEDGSLSLQIVESAQVEMESKEQRMIWNSATHFNPVDIVCGVRDYQGNPFDLKQYVDQDAVFISRKSKDGRALKALELPGLWNGAMADWITVFVEVPIQTFNPVKTINDLLRKEHQPQG